MILLFYCKIGGKKMHPNHKCSSCCPKCASFGVNWSSLEENTHTHVHTHTEPHKRIHVSQHGESVCPQFPASTSQNENVAAERRPDYARRAGGTHPCTGGPEGPHRPQAQALLSTSAACREAAADVGRDHSRIQSCLFGEHWDTSDKAPPQIQNVRPACACWQLPFSPTSLSFSSPQSISTEGQCPQEF